MAWITGWKPRWPNITASSICFSGSSLASDSTIMTASPVPATTRSSVALAHLVDHRVEHELAVDDADAGSADRAQERQAGERQGRGSGHQADDVGIILHVVGEHGDDHLRLVLEAVHEQRPDRPVDQARGQRLLLGGATLALEKATGDLAGGVGLLLVVDGEREEIDARPDGSCRRPPSPARSSHRTGRARRRRPGGPCGPSPASACGRPILFPRVVFRTSASSRFLVVRRASSAATSWSEAGPHLHVLREREHAPARGLQSPASGGFPGAR